MADVKWKGADKFVRYLQTTPGVVSRDVEAALYQEAENMMTVSLSRTPWEFGDLKRSAHVKLPVTKGGATSVELAYGTDYAIYVHEIESNQHPRGGQAKFLQSAVEERATALTSGLTKRIQAALRKRGL